MVISRCGLRKGIFSNGSLGRAPLSGVSFPDIVKLAQAYGLQAMRIEGDNFENQIDEALKYPGPTVCEVMLDPNQQFEPKISSKLLPDGRMVSSSLEDMFPFLDEKELLENMIIPLKKD